MNYYYHPNPETNSVLNSEESAHAIKVLRMKKGDTIRLMDGLGNTFTAEITDDNFRKCGFKITAKTQHPKKKFAIHIAIAPTKNIDRTEWFVEKACELGIDRISFIETKRTERAKINIERLEKKVIGAMKQSKNFWKCTIDEIQSLPSFLKSNAYPSDKFIAFVETGEESLLQKLAQPKHDTIILIGPEGDFTSEEVAMAKECNFQPVSLGNAILRTETAGIIAVHTVVMINQ